MPAHLVDYLLVGGTVRHHKRPVVLHFLFRHCRVTGFDAQRNIRNSLKRRVNLLVKAQKHLKRDDALNPQNDFPPLGMLVDDYLVNRCGRQRARGILRRIPLSLRT